MAALILLDALLAAGLVFVAWAALTGSRRFRTVILFVVFGLLLALAWARLGAVDLALAEAAIGAGVTGALFMAALDRLRREDSRDPHPEPVGLAAPALLAAGLAGAGIVGVLGQQPISGPPWADAMAGSGVDHPVTAVLLGFRAYDTLLEIAVLFGAGAAVHGLGLAKRPSGTDVGALQRGLLGLVAPLLVLLALYFLWRGSHAPGGAFQAGALLAAAGIFHQLTYAPGLMDRPAPWQRPAAAAGLAVFTGAALLTLALGEALAWPAGAAGGWILAIETAAAVSVGVLLTQLFVGGCPPPAGERNR